MCDTRVSVEHMSKMIQVRNVPDKLHRTLKSRAAAAGLSLSDYIKRDLEASAARPTFEEVDARVRARRRRSRVRTETIVSAIREVRDS
jgi:plasmid stability protein